MNSASTADNLFSLSSSRLKSINPINKRHRWTNVTILVSTLLWPFTLSRGPSTAPDDTSLPGTRLRIQHSFMGRKRRKWTAEEDALLRAAVQKGGQLVACWASIITF